MYGRADVNQSFFEKLPILVLSWDVCGIMLHVAYLDNKPLEVSMGKYFIVFWFPRCYVEFVEDFLAAFFQSPKPWLYPEDLVR